MREDNINENWNKFVAKLSEAPRGDWGEWSDSAEQAGPYDDRPDSGNMDDAEEVGSIQVTFTREDVRTIENAVNNKMDGSGILRHILDELNNRSGQDGELRTDGPQEPYFNAR